jgi:cobalt-zinc-cadmium efflux system membrane fusion protein
MTMNKITNLIFLFSALILGSCGSSEPEKTSGEVLAPNQVELNTEQFKTAGIALGRPEDRTIRTVLKVNGTVNVPPQNIASVSAPLGGFVKSAGPVQGSAVTKGETLALIENMAFIELQQSYLETRAKFTFAEIEFKRHSDLYKENVYSEKNVQQVETEYKTLKSQLRALEEKLLMLGVDPSKLTEENLSSVMTLLAPISGYIRTVNVNIGKYVNPTDVLFEIVDPRTIILELTVFEKDVPAVSNGQRLTFSTPNDPSAIFEGTIYQAGKTLDNDKTSRAYARIDNPGGKLLSGMYVNAGIETSSRSVVAVPQDAVVEFNSAFWVFVHKGIRMENGKEIHDFEAVQVQKGATDGGFTEILLPVGTTPATIEIAVKGAYSVLSAWKNAGEMAC